MIINNLELIAPLLPKDNPKVFCHMQIVCRAKDHKDKRVKGGAIKTYFIKEEAKKAAANGIKIDTT